MRAAYVRQLGTAEEIRVGSVAEPILNAGQVLVEIELTTVNPVDVLVRSGVFQTPLELPFVIGRDLVGTVAALGPAAAGFAVGDRVWCNSLGHDGRQGAAAERAAVATERLYRLPAGVDPVTAVASVHPAATGYLALFTHGRLRPDETVLIGGAAGNVGSAMVVLAVQAGARVIGTAHPRDFEYCRSLGVTEVFDYRDEQLSAQVIQGYPTGVDLYTDTFGVNDMSTAVGLLNRRGRIVVLAGPSSNSVLPVGLLYLKDCSVLGFVISHANTDELAAAAKLINELLAAGRLRPRYIEIVPLDAAAQAHRRLEQGELRGRRLLLSTTNSRSAGGPDFDKN
ncbi:MAG: NADPH:quinone reductase [Actinomycetota bacterium]|nr:NADPH:quinone reductase [Actinomycetota bacterium]